MSGPEFHGSRGTQFGVISPFGVTKKAKPEFIMVNIEAKTHKIGYLVEDEKFGRILD